MSENCHPASLTGVSPAERSASHSQTFKSKDAGSYDPVTDDFDRFTQQLSDPLAARLIELAQLAPGQRVLDIGTGTGVVALKAAPRVRPGGNVVGIDLSDGMLAAATVKAAQAGLADCTEFHKMDAEALQLDNGSFDAVLSLLALLHFPSPLTALQEMFRVLRPGGRLVIAVGSGAPRFSLAGLLHRIGRLPEILLQLQGKQMTAPGCLNNLVQESLPAPDEPEETPLASRSLNRSDSIPPLVRQAGFANAQTYWEGHQTVLPTPEEFWAIQRTFSSIARKRLSAAPPEKVAALHEEFLENCRLVQSRGGRLVYPFAGFYVIAQRPA